MMSGTVKELAIACGFPGDWQNTSGRVTISVNLFSSDLPTSVAKSFTGHKSDVSIEAYGARNGTDAERYGSALITRALRAPGASAIVPLRNFEEMHPAEVRKCS